MLFKITLISQLLGSLEFFNTKTDIKMLLDTLNN